MSGENERSNMTVLSAVASESTRGRPTSIEERRRLGRFSSWDEVDQVRGVGVARLQALQEAAELTGSSDAGLP